MLVPRNELKFYISSAHADLLNRRLAVAMQKDSHTQRNRSYQIRSLYFEDPLSSAYFDKVNGLERRAKYRIRFYNGDLSYIRLEKKEKIGQKSLKSFEVITKDFAESLVRAEVLDSSSAGPLSREMIAKVRFERFRPLLFVDYRRSAYLHPVGNVRVTLDSAISGSVFRKGLEDDFLPIPVLNPGEAVLEIKYDSMIPPYISSLMADIPKVSCAISKFCKCREVLS